LESIWEKEGKEIKIQKGLRKGIKINIFGGMAT
jgi:hypothetical protein